MTDDHTLRERWQPVRGGLINLFKYEDQIFRYENGRLLLRGDNGSGKSRVLALQLPFLLDGEISPYRVEPDRDPAKRMEWHLLMDRHERRTGYTWIEFGRRDGDGVSHFLTLGCGLDARKGGGAPDRWFFITSRRIRLDGSSNWALVRQTTAGASPRSAARSRCCGHRPAPVGDESGYFERGGPRLAAPGAGQRQPTTAGIDELDDQNIEYNDESLIDDYKLCFLNL